MNQLTIFAGICTALLCQPLSADWYEATGQAIIEQGNVERARQAAIEDAVKRAALFAGASLSSTQQVINGVLQQEQLGFVANGEINQLQVLTETQENNLITITVRLNIEAEAGNCDSNSYRKPLLLSEIALRARQDAIYGDLFRIGNDATTQLERHLRDYSPTAAVSVLEQQVTIADLKYPLTEQLFNQGYQYVLTATINDMSLGHTTSHFWQKQQKERYFAIDVMLFDVFEQVSIFQQEYRSSATWPFQDGKTPASHSQAFWNMAYGQKVDQLLQLIAEDTQRQLACKPLMSSVLQVQANEVKLNLGHKHGLSVGDQLELFQVQRHPSSPGIKRVINSQLKLTISTLSEQYAWATPPAGELLQHIQPGDLLSVRKSNTE